jgi:hypothetical protein
MLLVASVLARIDVKSTPCSLIPFQLPLSPMVVFAVGIENPLAMAVDSLHYSRLREDHGVAVLRRPHQAMRGCLPSWRAH